MSMPRRTPFIAATLALVTACALLVPGLAAWQDTRTIYLSIVDGQGNAVTDIKPDEVFLREDNSNREVVSVTKAAEPLEVILLADTSQAAGGTGMMTRQDTIKGTAELIQDIRAAFTGFVKTLNTASPESQMQIIEFGQAAVPVTKMTSNFDDLDKGIKRLFPKPQAAAVLLEAIMESAKMLGKAKSPRRAIVILNAEPSNEQSRQQPNAMLQEVIKANAQVWAVSIQQGSQRNEARGLVLDALAKNTGGRREFLVGQAAIIKQMEQFASNLAGQYAVTYRRTGDGQPRLLQVGLARQGLKMFTSIYPQK